MGTITSEITFELLDYGAPISVEFTVEGYSGGEEYNWVIDCIYDYEQDVEVKLDDLSPSDKREIADGVMQMSGQLAYKAFLQGAEDEADRQLDLFKDYRD